MFQESRDGSTNQRFSFNEHYAKSKNKKVDTHTLQMALKMPKNYSQSLRPQYQGHKAKIMEQNNRIAGSIISQLRHETETSMLSTRTSPRPPLFLSTL